MKTNSILKQIFISALFISGALFAQKNVTYKIGDPFKFPKKHFGYGFYPAQNGNFIQLSLRPRKKFSFQEINSQTLALENQAELDVKEVDYEFEHQIITLKNKTYWYYSRWTRSDKTEHLYYQEFDIQNHQFLSDKKLIIEDEKMSFGLNGIGGDKYNFFTSSDSSLLLVAYRIKPENHRDAENQDVIAFNVFDKNMKQVWKSKVTLPYTEKMMDNSGITIDSKGNVYFLAKVYDSDEKVRKNDKDPTYHYEVLRYKEGSARPDIIKVDFKGKFVQYIRINEHDGKLTLVGYYSNKALTNSSDGAFYISLNNADSNDPQKGFYPFPDEVLKKYLTAREQKKIDKKQKEQDVDPEAGNLVLNKIYINEDGTCTLFGEVYYSVTTTYYDGKYWHTYTTYYYQDIIAMKIDPKENKMVWCKKFPKNQVGRGTADLSYSVFEYNRNYYLFYLDNKKNIDLPENTRPYVHSAGAGGFLMMIKIDGNSGMAYKEHLFDIREVDIKLYPDNFSSFEKGKIIGRAREDGGSCLVRFDLR